MLNVTRNLTLTRGPVILRLTLTVKVLGSECVTCDSLRDTPRDDLRDTGPFLDTDHGAET